MTSEWGEVEKLLQDLIVLLGSQEAVAKALSISKQQLYYWCHHVGQVTFEQKKLLTQLLHKQHRKHAQQKISEILSRDYPVKSIALNVSQLRKVYQEYPCLSFSQRVELAFLTETVLGDRQGCRNDLTCERHLCADFVEQLSFNENEVSMRTMTECRDIPRGRTLTLVAQWFGFSSVYQYQQAKVVHQAGDAALMQAVDAQAISIHQAFLKAYAKKSIKIPSSSSKHFIRVLAEWIRSLPSTHVFIAIGLYFLKKLIDYFNVVLHPNVFLNTPP